MVFDLNPFKPVTFSSTAKNKVTKKKPLATMFFIQLLLRFSRVKLDSLEARLRPVEQLDKRTPRGTSSLLRGNRVHIIMDV
jgi:hypothetical protein